MLRWECRRLDVSVPGVTELMMMYTSSRQILACDVAACRYAFGSLSYHQGSPSRLNRLLQWISYANTGGMCLCYSVCISTKTGIYFFKFTVFMLCTICIYQCVCSSCKHGSNKSVNTSKNNSACHKICITTRLKLPWISSIHSLTFILLFFSPSSHAYRNNREKNSHATQPGCAIFVALPNDSVCFITCYFECSYTHR